MKKIYSLIILMSLSVSIGFSQLTYLSTPLVAGNGQSGITFNVTAIQNVFIEDVQTTFTGSGTAEVWYNTTAISGPPTITTAAGWTQITTGAVTPSGAGLSSSVGPMSLFMPAGSTWGFYVGGVGLSYTNGGAVTSWTDGNITIDAGSLVGYGGAAPNPTFHIRMFNGQIGYRIAAGGANDATTSNVFSNISCPGTDTVFAEVANFGINQIDSVMVNWAINGVLQTPINYIGLLDTFGGVGPNSATIALGAHTFVAGVSDTFDVWTSMPNGIADTVTNNDSNSVILRPALPGGTYTIGGASPDYATFAGALTDLNDNGVCGPVVFNVRQGTYNERILLDNIAGVSSTNTVTFQSDPANTSKPLIQGSGTSSADNYTLRLTGAQHITFDSLDFRTTGTTWSRVVDIPSAVNDITFDGCRFEGWASATTSTFQIVFYQMGGITDNLTVNNCEFEGGSYSFYVRGSSTTVKSTNTTITNNRMNNGSSYQAYLWYQDTITFDNNIMVQRPTSTSFTYGIYAFYCDNSTFRKNSVTLNTTSTNYGMYLFRAGGGSNEVSNNMIVTSANTTTGTAYGLWENTGLNVNIYHNSIHVRAGGTNTRALYINGSTSTLYGNNNVVNNIAVNSVNGGNALYINAAGTAPGYMTQMDKNIYFASGANPFNYNFTNYPTLAAYQALATTDSNSYFGDPGFFGPANLRLQGTLAVDSGLNVGIMTDIDGDVRPIAPSTGYDIGADEYIPPTCPSPTAIRTAFLTSDSALISWTNGIADSSWSIEWGATGFTPGTGTVITSGNDSIGINGLSPLTCYDVWVKSICTVGDTSILYGPFNFCTPCSSYSPPYSEDFTTMNFTNPPTCWEEASGLLTINSSLSYGASIWGSDGFANIGFTGCAKLDVSFTGRDEWLISPTIDLGTGAIPYQVEFDIAMTASFSPTPVVGGTMGPDDKFVLLISTDNGTTWSDTNILRQWDTTDLASFTGEYFSFDLTAAGYTGEVRLAFYGESTISNARTEVFIDNFAVVQVPTCPRPTRLRQDTNTTTSIDASWTNGASDVSWEIEYGPIGFTPGFGTVGYSPTNPATITGLTPSTCYDVYLRSICSAGDTSIQIGPQRMCTECGPVVDLCEDFETSDPNVLPICWEVFIASTYTGTSPAYAQVETFGGNLGPQSIQLDSRSAGTSATTIILSTPEMTALPLGTHRAEFWLDGSFTPDTTLIIGTITDPANPATFTPFDTINDITSSYQRYRIPFDSYTGTDTRIAFLYTPTANFRTINIDDFCFERIPTCERPPSVQVLNDGVDSNYINLGWNQDTTWFTEPLKYQKEFIITYGPTGFTPGDASVIDTLYTSTTVAPAPSNNFSQITGLRPLTEYCFWVKAICDNGDTSAWSGPHCGTTGCPSGAALPYSEDFTDYRSVFPLDETPQCWEEATGPLGGSIALMTESIWEPDGFGNVNFTGAARFNISAFGVREGWIVSPTFELGTDPNIARIVEFDVALTDDFNSNPAINGFGDDDTIALVVSYDEGVTWNKSDILLQWDTSNEPSNTGDRIVYIMRGQTGKVKFGFYGVSNVANEGVDFFVDNFSIRDTTWVSVEENTLDLERFAVYPNPNTGIFTVQNKGKANTSSVKLMDMAGRLVYDSQMTFAKNGTQEIQVENLKSGVYVLLLQSEGKLEQHRIVVQ